MTKQVVKMAPGQNMNNCAHHRFNTWQKMPKENWHLRTTEMIPEAKKKKTFKENKKHIDAKPLDYFYSSSSPVRFCTGSYYAASPAP